MDELESLKTDIRGGLQMIDAADELKARGIIKAGSALIKAKKKIKHGEWQAWLKENFNLTVRTAQIYMACAERFSKTKLISLLKSPTQFICFLALPAGDEETFLAEKTAEGVDVAALTIRALRAEIKAWKVKSSNADEKIAALKKENAAKDKKIAELEQKLKASPPKFFKDVQSPIEIFLQADDREQILNRLAEENFSRYAAVCNDIAYFYRELVNRKRAERARRADNSRQLLILEL